LKLIPLFPASFSPKNFFLLGWQELPPVASPAKEKIVFREKDFPFQSGLVTQFADIHCARKAIKIIKIKFIFIEFSLS